MQSDTSSQGICDAMPISNEHQRRIFQLMAQEVKLATDEARSIAIKDARGEAEGIKIDLPFYHYAWYTRDPFKTRRVCSY